MSVRTGPERASNLNKSILIFFAIQLVAATVTNYDKILLWRNTGGARVHLAGDDSELYYNHASPILAGQVPYRDYPVEYPLLAIPLFLAPRLVAAELGPFQLLFGAEMLSLNAALVLLVARQVERQAGLVRVAERLAWYTLYFVLLSRLLLRRFDLAPALLTFAAVASWSARRPSLAGVLAGVGVMVKLYPGIVAVPVMAADRTQSRSARLCGLAVTLCFVLGGSLSWYALGGNGFLDSIRYHADRGLEHGSGAASLTILAATLSGEQVALAPSHGSMDVVTNWSTSIALLLHFALIAAEAGVAWVSWRRGVGPFQSAAAAILGFMLASKVGSPQYLIWLMPFMPVLEGRSGRFARPIFASCCLCSALGSAAARSLGHLHLLTVLAIALKNALLLLLFSLLISGRCHDSSQ